MGRGHHLPPIMDSRGKHGKAMGLGIPVWRFGGRVPTGARLHEYRPVAVGHCSINKLATTACNYTIEESVRNIAPQIEVIKAELPDIKVGDGEPQDLWGNLNPYRSERRISNAQPTSGSGPALP
jgi:hypothetical protein